MTLALKKKLDNTPNQVYTILSRDEGGFYLPPSFSGGLTDKTYKPYVENNFLPQLHTAREAIKAVYEANPTLFSTPPVFAGGYFRDMAYGRFPADLDLFFNSHGMEKEEAEDNLCLFLHKLGWEIRERVNNDYANSPGTFLVFDQYDWPQVFGGIALCPVQFILKDMGPPEDDPLYVTRDFHYNHGMMAVPVVGEFAVHCSGAAVFGWENKCHVQYQDKGFEKAVLISRKDFKMLDLTKPIPKNLVEAKKMREQERNAKIAKFNKIKGPALRPMFQL